MTVDIPASSTDDFSGELKFNEQSTTPVDPTNEPEPESNESHVVDHPPHISLTPLHHPTSQIIENPAQGVETKSQVSSNLLWN